VTIKVLGPDLVSKIAAGEVIERPASVVKELVENSLDARSTQVTIDVHNGGLSLIRVTDNGSGIPASELQTAFLSHATSKLNNLADLETINSLGFRGEALPSIAAVADVEIVTSARGEDAGTYLKLTCGEAAQSGTRAHPQGTTMTVHSLFRTTPARLKFMKSPRAESARIAYLVTQFALAYPEVRFTLSIDGRTTIRTAGTGKLLDVLAQVYGSEMAAEMLVLPEQQQHTAGSPEAPLTPVVTGLVSPPQLSRSNRTYVSFFVNRRWVSDRTLGRAVDEAYQGLLMVGRHPVVVLNIFLPPATVDVNVHPAKREVRFRYENLVFSTVNRAIRKALGGAPVPSINLPGQPNPPFASGPAWQNPMPIQSPAWQPTPVPQPGSWPEEWDRKPEQEGMGLLRVLGQIDNTYIVAESSTGLYLVDQHAAHERVLFDRLRAPSAGTAIDIQGLLEPAVVELGPEEEEVLRARETSLSSLGFTIEPFGDRTYLVRAVPAAITEANVPDVLREILSSSGKLEDQEWHERAAASLACHGAIKAGQRLDPKEATELLQQLEQSASPRTCPHGRPTMIHLSSGELRKHFGRE